MFTQDQVERLDTRAYFRFEELWDRVLEGMELGELTEREGTEILQDFLKSHRKYIMEE